MLPPVFPLPTFPGQFPSPPIRACRTPLASPYASHLPPSIPLPPSGVTFIFVDLLMLQMNFGPTVIGSAGVEPVY